MYVDKIDVLEDASGMKASKIISRHSFSFDSWISWSASNQLFWNVGFKGVTQNKALSCKSSRALDKKWVVGQIHKVTLEYNFHIRNDSTAAIGLDHQVVGRDGGEDEATEEEEVKRARRWGLRV